VDNLFSADPYANRFLYTGREFLKEANLYDYRNRVYSAELGRFLQTDPIRLDAGDVNLYRYVGNNSVNISDPSGLSGLFPYGTNAIQNFGPAPAKLGAVAKGTGLGGFVLGYLANYDKFLDCLDRAAENLAKNSAMCCPTDTACQALANAIYASECASCAQTQIANSLGADQMAAAISNGLNIIFPGSK
jgi:RHS repeat-associated protein